MLTRGPVADDPLARVRTLLADDRVVLGLCTAAVVLTVLGLFNLTWYVTIGLVGPTFLLIATSLITWRLVVSTARLADFPHFVRLVLIGIVVKVVGTGVRFYVTNSVYDGGDEATYHTSAVEIGLRIQDGVWSLQGTPIEPYGFNTHVIAWILGPVYAVAGGARWVGTAFFSWMGFIGVLLIYRAYRTAFPDLPSKVFAYFLFLLPSLVYWPSTVGKEAFMLLGMGIAVVGLSMFLAGRGVLGPFALVVTGLACLSYVRPHMALLLIGAVVPAVMVRAPTRGGRRRQGGRVIMLALVLVLLMATMSSVDQFFGGNGLSGGTEQAQNQTQTGGSTFTARPVTSPVDLPIGFVDVLLRPFPWQASGTGLIASMEGVALLGLLVWRWRVLGRLPKAFFTRPGVAFAVSYAVLFVVAFSNISNAGILARQRTQMLPFLLMALCAAWSSATAVSADAATEPPRPPTVPVRPPTAPVRAAVPVPSR